LLKDNFGVLPDFFPGGQAGQDGGGGFLAETSGKSDFNPSI
jgi:hypothetical protein